MSELPIHVKMYNDKVRIMNQSNSKILTLNQQEARSLHAEIYDLMATITNLNKGSTHSATATEPMDGGAFK